MSDRQASGHDDTRLDKLIRSIPIFAGLETAQAKAVLTRCRKVSLDAGEVLCRQGEQSDALFILLQGGLVVKITNSSAIAMIHPVSSIGELGVFTGDPRTATVEAAEPSVLLALSRTDLDALIEQDPRLGVTVMRRVIGILAGWIDDDNRKIREYQQYVVDRGDR